VEIAERGNRFKTKPKGPFDPPGDGGDQAIGLFPDLCLCADSQRIHEWHPAIKEKQKCTTHDFNFIIDLMLNRILSLIVSWYLIIGRVPEMMETEEYGRRVVSKTIGAFQKVTSQKTGFYY
jgi:hypothetical protein